MANVAIADDDEEWIDARLTMLRHESPITRLAVKA